MKILSRLLDNCRESDRSMGMNIGITGAAVKARIQRMQNAGIIQRFIVKVEPPLLGLDVLYLVATGEDTEEIARQAGLVGKPYLLVPCVGGITVCGIVINSNESIPKSIRLIKEIMKETRILSIFEAESEGPDTSLTKTDLRILDSLIAEPRRRSDSIAEDTGFSTKTIARCRDKLNANPGVQFTVVYDPKRIGRYIPHVVLVTTTRKEPECVLHELDERFSGSYMQAPFVAKNQIVLFMYSRTIYEMDEIVQRIRHADYIKAADLFIPKEIFMYNKWLTDVIGDTASSPRLHLAPPS